jgi:ribonuclease P protein subunit RPP14
VSRDRLREIRVKAIENQLLKCDENWKKFSIWGAGRYGKKFFRALSDGIKHNVSMFLDIDFKVIGQCYNGPRDGRYAYNIPICHFSQGKPPIVICVSPDRDGALEANLKSLNLTEGTDYLFFS